VVRGNVVDLTARDTNVQKLAVRQATQLGSLPLAFAPLLKGIPICSERTVDLSLTVVGPSWVVAWIVLIAECPV
jgi:hypothetical protein